MAELLTEEIKALEAKLAQAETVHTTNLHLRDEINTLKQEKAAWLSYLEHNNNDQDYTPQKLSRNLASKRLENVELTNRIGEMRAALIERETALASIQKDFVQLQAEKTALEDSNSIGLRAYKRVERAKAVLQKEVEFLRAQVQSIESEETFVMCNGSNTVRGEHLQRVQQLQGLLDDSRSQISELHDQLRDAETSHSLVFKAPEPDHAVAACARAQIDSLQSEISSLRKDNALLRKEIDAQNHIKMIELSHNPVTAANESYKTSINALRAENTALLKQLHHSSHNSQAMDTSDSETVFALPETMARLQQDNQTLTSQNMAAEKRLQRLKEIYAAKTMSFRTSLQMLIGYKIDFLDDDRVQMTSIYCSARDFQDKTLSFTMIKDENSGKRQLALKKTPWVTENLLEIFDRHVGGCELRADILADGEAKGVPAFLSDVTLRLCQLRQDVGK